MNVRLFVACVAAVVAASLIDAPHVLADEAAERARQEHRDRMETLFESLPEGSSGMSGDDLRAAAERFAVEHDVETLSTTVRCKPGVCAVDVEFDESENVDASFLVEALWAVDHGEAVCIETKQGHVAVGLSCYMSDPGARMPSPVTTSE